MVIAGAHFEADEPEVLAGGDVAPAPAEYLLAALASCITSSIVLHSAMRGIEVRDLEVQVYGGLDTNGLTGLSDVVPKGYQQIRATIDVDASASADEILVLAQFSPTLNTIAQGGRVDLQVTKQEAKAPSPVERAARA